MNQIDFVGRYGPVALVTGASSGIGMSFAKRLAAQGFDLVVIARRVERLNELAQQLHQKHGVKVQVLQIDLSDRDAAQSILDATASLDIGLVVSNAGFGLKGAYTSGDPQTLSEMLMVNCHTTMQLARGFIPRLQRRGQGGLILTSSVEGLIGCPYSAAYAASKAFVNSLGEALWAELTPDRSPSAAMDRSPSAAMDRSPSAASAGAQERPSAGAQERPPEGIDVLTLCPGATDTEAPRKQGFDPAKMQNVMSPDEVAQLALDNIRNGPVYIPSPHYKASFERLLSMPRRDALTAMAKGMKPR